jgi:anthranilate/para-aminobenzoate synthase component I
MSSPQGAADRLELREAAAGQAAGWRAHLRAARPRAWLGPFHGRWWRGARPVESWILRGSGPEDAILECLGGGRRLRVDDDPFARIEAAATRLGLAGAGWISHECGRFFEALPRPAAAPGHWPLLRVDFFAEQEQGPAVPWSPDPPPAPAAPPPVPLWPAGRYAAGVSRVRHWITEGDLYQLNLVQPFVSRWPWREAACLFARLRSLDPAPTGCRALLEPGGGRALVSDSPELFLRRRGLQIEAQPIKGTQPADRDPAELLASVKDRAELAMIVDLMRNDLARVCRPGSVAVGRVPELLELPTLRHTCATVSGLLLPGAGLAACLRAAFPAGSISGCPRRRALERITELEGVARGPCMGSVLLVEPGGDFALSVAIRTALLSRGGLRLLAGGGLTVDSDPRAEAAESRLKTRAFAQALALVGGREG